MNELLTPFGKIMILFDETPIDYVAVDLPRDKDICPDVNGRFKIEFFYESDNTNHTLSCVIDRLFGNVQTEMESDENYTALELYLVDIKLTIGCTYDGGYIRDDNGELVRLQGYYDYDFSYSDNGVEYNILPITKSNMFVFGISWIKPCTEENDIQTFDAADPFFMKKSFAKEAEKNAWRDNR